MKNVFFSALKAEIMRVDSWCDTQLECCCSPQGLRSVYPTSVATRGLSVLRTAHKHIRNKLAFCCFVLSLLVFTDDVQYESVFAANRHYSVPAGL